MKRNHPVFPLLATMAAIFLPLSAHALSPVGPAETSEAPAEAIPWSEIGARAGADYEGDGLSVTATCDGAVLKSVFQRLRGEATPEGLWLNSTAEGSDGDRFRVMASAVGRTGGQKVALPQVGRVVTEDKLVSYIRPGLIEEYSTSMDGVRQDFLVLERPEGEGELRVELALDGAWAEEAHFGARLVLEGSGRKIAYSRLHVVDASGRELSARIEVTAAHRLEIVVADANAAYPVRIDPTFSDEKWISMGAINGANDSVLAAVVDGAGNLYVGGVFTVVGDIRANHVAKWDGSGWSALGSGVTSGQYTRVHALLVSGNDLYVGGDFTFAGGISSRCIAKWAIGSTSDSGWSSLGSGVNRSGSVRVYALAAVGNDLYVGGLYTSAGGVSGRNNIAKWTMGSTGNSGWTGLGSGVGGAVNALAVAGNDLYVGGSFLVAGGVLQSNIAKWMIGSTTDSGWGGLGSGVSGHVQALTIAGTDLYVGGSFSNVGGVSGRNSIAKWTIGSPTDSGWTGLGSGVNGTVNALSLSGSDLYVGGTFNTAGSIFGRNNVAKWTIGATADSGWSEFGSGVGGTVNALAVSGNNLYVGGGFIKSGGVLATNRIVNWNIGATTNTGWAPLETGEERGLSGIVRALAVDKHDLYVGGDFVMAGNLQVNRVAKWDGNGWSALGSGVNSGSVHALVVSGNDLYVGGGFSNVGGVSGRNCLAKWNIGSTTDSGWAGLGSGVNNTVRALAVSGSDLYAGGSFDAAGGVSNRNRVAKWVIGSTTNSGWSSLGSGTDGTVHALATAGGALFVGGEFDIAGGVAGRRRVAKWNIGSATDSGWVGLGSGVNNTVYALAISGSDLYVGGSFTIAGGITRSRIAKWNIASTTDSGWTGLGSGVVSWAVGGTVHAIGVSGSDLYVGGTFDTAGGISNRNQVAKWVVGSTTDNGWSSLGSGTNGTVHVIGSGSGLFVGGEFASAGDKATAHVAYITLPHLPTTIEAFPHKEQTVALGGNVFFDVKAFGSSPYIYQWYKNGVALENSERVAGATSSRLEIYQVGNNDVGIYHVHVKGYGGTAVSEGVQLTVVQPAIFEPRGILTVLPSYVNVAFQLTDLSGRGINIPRGLFDQATDIFQVREEGTAISPTESFLQVGKMDEVPAIIRTVILLDNSASVGINLLQVRQAASALVDQILPQQEMAIYSFSSHLTELQTFTRDKTALKAAINGMPLGAATTDLNGSILTTLGKWEEIFNESGIETGFLVVFTDGVDNMGVVTTQAALDKRNADKKRIFMIGLGNEIDPQALSTMGNAGSWPISRFDQLENAFAEVQQSIEDTANSFYWVNYASPRRGNFIRNLTISLKGNTYTGEGSVLAAQFSSAGFSEVERGVTINRRVDRTGGVTSLAIAPDATDVARAFTILPLVGGGAEFTWTLDDPSLAALVSLEDDDSRMRIVPNGRDGTTTLTIVDTVNSSWATLLGLSPTTYTKTITLVIGTGVASEPYFGTWASAAGLTGPNAEPGAIPFGDGVSNLLKFAFNMDASRVDNSRLIAGGGGTSGLPAVALDPSEPEPVLTIEFLRRRDSNLIYTPQFSSDMDDWPAANLSLMVVPIDDQWERVTVKDPGSWTGTGSRFGRVKVTLP